MNAIAPPPTIAIPTEIDDMVDHYVRLRDKIKEADEGHKTKTAPARAHLETLNAAIVAKLNEIGGESVKTKFGTAYKTSKKSATIADAGVFRQYVIDNMEFDLVDWRANPTAVAEFIDNTGNGEPPPGVNYSVFITAGVRRG